MWYKTRYTVIHREDWFFVYACSQITRKLVFVVFFPNMVLFMFVNQHLLPLIIVGHENTFSFQYGFPIALCSEHFEIYRRGRHHADRISIRLQLIEHWKLFPTKATTNTPGTPEPYEFFNNLYLYDTYNINLKLNDLFVSKWFISFFRLIFLPKEYYVLKVLKKCNKKKIII